MRVHAIVVGLFALTLVGTSGGRAVEDAKWKLAFPTEADTRDKGVKSVTAFLNLQLKAYKGDPNQAGKTLIKERLAFVSQEYLASRKVQPEGLTINGHRADGFTIENVFQNYVTAVVFHKENGWKHRMTFRLLLENGRLVIEPSGTNEIGTARYLTPWWVSEQNVKG